MSIRTGLSLTPAERLESDLLSARLSTRRARRHFVEALSNVIIIIGGFADPVVNLARGLTIWSMLVLGVGFACLVLIRAYMAGLLDVQLMFSGVFTTLLIAMLIAGRFVTAARRAQITIQRLQIPDWLTEEA